MCKVSMRFYVSFSRKTTVRFGGGAFPTLSRLDSKCDIAQKAENKSFNVCAKFECVPMCRFRKKEGCVFRLAHFPPLDGSTANVTQLKKLEINYLMCVHSLNVFLCVVFEKKRTALWGWHIFHPQTARQQT